MSTISMQAPADDHGSMLDAAPPPELAMAGPREAPERGTPDWNSASAGVWKHSHDLVEVSFGSGCVLEADIVNEVAHGVGGLMENPPVRVLIDVSGLARVEPAAAAKFRKVEGVSRLALIGYGPADQVLARFFMTSMAGGTNVPIDYFQDRAAAFEYLGGYV